MEKEISVPTVTLDISVQYKGEFLNNCTVELFGGALDTGVIPLGKSGRGSIILNEINTDLTLRLTRTPEAPQDDTSKYPVLAGDFPFGPIAGNERVLIIVAEPTR